MNHKQEIEKIIGIGDVSEERIDKDLWHGRMIFNYGTLFHGELVDLLEYCNQHRIRVKITVPLRDGKHALIITFRQVAETAKGDDVAKPNAIV